MAKKTIKLTHTSYLPDASGTPGTVIECDAKIAERFIEAGGAEEVESEKPAPKKRSAGPLKSKLVDKE